MTRVERGNCEKRPHFQSAGDMGDGYSGDPFIIINHMGHHALWIFLYLFYVTILTIVFLIWPHLL